MRTNPFADLIVIDPRQPEPVVGGLNDRPLRDLLGEFERLQEGPAPRTQKPARHAQLITSPEPGFGKSHLIGRLFRELHGKATLVYVLPFQNPTTVFQSLMMAIAREIHFPDRAGSGGWNPEEASQLDLLAHAVLANLLADLVESRRVIDAENPGEIAATLRRDPLRALNRGAAGDSWADWLRQHFETLRPFLDECLSRRGVSLKARGWLRVLLTYAFAPFQPSARQMCLDWIVGQPLGDEERERIGLRGTETVDGDITPEQANDLCRTRVADLCQLACFYRPFVFCFDQTEVYGHHAGLARSFGMVLAALVNEATNHLTLVTSNQHPWVKRIQPNIEEADLDRIARPPVILEGLNRQQGEELVHLRLQSGLPNDPRNGNFLRGDWLSELFPTDRNQMGARHFLQKCKERWDNEPLRVIPLPDLYQQRLQRLITAPKRLLFEPDSLQWVIEEAARGLEEVTVERVEGERYFSVVWKTPDRWCFFGFLGGANWRQWKAVAQEATARREKGPVPARAIFFRTPELPPVPNPRWQHTEELDEAIRCGALQLIHLRSEEVAALYAAKDLFAEAAQGDIAFTGAEVLAFLREELRPWWRLLRGAEENVEPVAAEALPDQAMA